MANNCFYMMKAVAPKRESLDELYKLMNYDHPDGLHMCRIFSCTMHERSVKQRDDGKWEAEYSGDCAWSLTTCITEDGYWGDIKKSVMGEDGHFMNDTLDDFRNGKVLHVGQVASRYGMAMEWWSEEEGMEFQEHVSVSPYGMVELDSVHWEPEHEKCDDDWNPVLDEDGDPVIVPQVGGYPDYGEFSI